MKKKLFDFSVGTGLSAVFSFTLLLIIFAYHGFGRGGITARIFFFALLLALLFLLYRFVLRAAVLEEDGIRQGNIFIKKKNLRIAPVYDPRFKESIYRMRDASADYSGLSEKEREKVQIRVEATPANRRKLEAYLGGELPPAPKPKYRFGKRK